VLAGNPSNFYFCRLITKQGDVTHFKRNADTHTTHRLNKNVLTIKKYEDEAVGGFISWIICNKRNREGPV
jgi:hypothetical protein